MSIRALGRQFVSHVRNYNKQYWPGSPEHPQGQLFLGGGGQLPLLNEASKEAGRRRTAGESNPDAPWKTPFLQHHFQPTHDRRTGRPLPPAPVEQKLFE